MSIQNYRLCWLVLAPFLFLYLSGCSSSTVKPLNLTTQQPNKINSALVMNQFESENISYWIVEMDGEKIGNRFFFKNNVSEVYVYPGKRNLFVRVKENLPHDTSYKSFQPVYQGLVKCDFKAGRYYTLETSFRGTELSRRITLGSAFTTEVLYRSMQEYWTFPKTVKVTCVEHETRPINKDFARREFAGRLKVSTEFIDP